MSYEHPKLSDNPSENEFLHDVLDKEKLSGATPDEIERRKTDIPNLPNGSLNPTTEIDLSKIVDTSGNKLKAHNSASLQLGALAIEPVVDVPQELPPPTLNGTK